MEWTSQRLEQQIESLRARRGDSTDVEVKSASGGVPRLADTLCAFGNMPEGGTIILGLDEQDDFRPVGLTNVAALEQSVASQARTGVSPPVQCDFQSFDVDGNVVLVVDVHGLPLAERPARHGGRAYLRQSDGDYVMSEQELAQMELLKTQAHRPTRPDREPIPGTSVDDLEPDLVAQFLRVARTDSRRYATASDEQILRYTNVTEASGELTLAGLYAMGRSPQTYSPALGVTAAVQLPRGSSKRRLRALRHFVGPIPVLLDDVLAWVVSNTLTAMGYGRGGHGEDRPELPEEAVREIVANALVHRNLDPITDSKRVELRLLPDRLVITSPGGLWGVSESQLGRAGAKSAVNPVLYDICTFLRTPDGKRVIEGEGGGIGEAIEALQDAGLAAPQFSDTGLQVSVIIRRPRPEVPKPAGSSVALTRDAPASVALIESGPTSDPGRRRKSPASTRHAPVILEALTDPRSLTELQDATGLSAGQLHYALTKLRTAGLVTMQGTQGDPRTTYARSSEH